MIGYAMCGSFCTLSKSVETLRALADAGNEIQPIMSEPVYSLDTRFGAAAERRDAVEEICKRKIIHTLADAEPLGPAHPLEALIVAPCTGNTLAKCVHGVTDTAVTMAMKAHLRVDRPLLIAFCSNDGLSQNLANIASFLSRKSVYFVPMKQDDPEKKPHSLIADYAQLPAAFAAMKERRQLRPLFL